MVNRGEIWWHEHPHESRRPYLVLHRNEAIPVLNQLLAAPLTRTRRGIPTEVDLDPSDGVPEHCVISLDNLRLVRPALLTERLTTLGAARLHDVCTALRHAIAC
jgi:mRNA interferase MazF